MSEKEETAKGLAISVLAKLSLRKRCDNQTIWRVRFTVITTGLQLDVTII